jgi:hypothetical protein
MPLRLQPHPLLVLIAAGAMACGDSRPGPGAAPDDPWPGGAAVSHPPAAPDRHLVSDSAVGPVRLGMTLDKARRALPAARFERTSDGEGVALVEVTLDSGGSMVLYAGEDDPEAPIAGAARIEMIETFSPAFHTADGVRPGSLVTDAQRVYGGIRSIVRSEIESREYIEFERQPAGLLFRLDYTGIFPPDSSTTTEHEPGARIHSIAVSS